MNPFEKTKLCLHATTPFEKFQDINGILFYDPEEKHVSVNLTSAHLQVRTDIIYVYNNISNFHLKLEVITPMSYLSSLILVGMFNGKAVSPFAEVKEGKVLASGTLINALRYYIVGLEMRMEYVHFRLRGSDPFQLVVRSRIRNSTVHADRVVQKE